MFGTDGRTGGRIELQQYPSVTMAAEGKKKYKTFAYYNGHLIKFCKTQILGIGLKRPMTLANPQNIVGYKQYRVGKFHDLENIDTGNLRPPSKITLSGQQTMDTQQKMNMSHQSN